MSRWIERYKAHPFHEVWTSLKQDLSASKVDDTTVLTSVTELARLKKVVAYLDGLLKSIDPELVPITIWDNFNEQATSCANQIATFRQRKDISAVQTANSHADNLLTYLRPYMVVTGRVGNALRDSVMAYSSAMTQQIDAFRITSSVAVNEIKGLVDESQKLKIDIENVDGSARTIGEELTALRLDVTEKGNDITETFSEARLKVERLREFHDKTLVGSEEEPSLRKEMSDAVEFAKQQRKAISEQIVKIDGVVDNLTGFHTKIFGPLDSDGKRAGGLAAEVDIQRERLVEFEREQKVKYRALNDQIESLLPGATSAGLASAYGQLKSSFETPIKNANRLFYGAIGILIIGGIILAIEKVSLANGIAFAQVQDWPSFLRSLAHRLPFYGPIIWLAYYATKRRSEFQRLQQEYAHKEALSKSYESYKKQIEDLGGNNEEMLKGLMMRAIEAISRNASDTLDGKHGDKMPVHEIVEKTLNEALGKKSLIDRLKALV